MSAHEITIAAKPQAIEVDLAKTAILVVDMQNDFGARGGMFERGGVDIGPIQRVVAPIRNVLEAGREAGLPIVFLKRSKKRKFSTAPTNQVA
jgi:ureidoacrylate peracid hydrolase